MAHPFLRPSSVIPRHLDWGGVMMDLGSLLHSWVIDSIHRTAQARYYKSKHNRLSFPRPRAWGGKVRLLVLWAFWLTITQTAFVGISTSPPQSTFLERQEGAWEETIRRQILTQTLPPTPTVALPLLVLLSLSYFENGNISFSAFAWIKRVWGHACRKHCTMA